MGCLKPREVKLLAWLTQGQSPWSPDCAEVSQIFRRLALAGVMAMMESNARGLEEAQPESVPFPVERPLPARTELGAPLVPCSVST